jgi:hypothetical protein
MTPVPTAVAAVTDGDDDDDAFDLLIYINFQLENTDLSAAISN